MRLIVGVRHRIYNIYHRILIENGGLAELYPRRFKLLLLGSLRIEIIYISNVSAFRDGSAMIDFVGGEGRRAVSHVRSPRLMVSSGSAPGFSFVERRSVAPSSRFHPWPRPAAPAP